MADDDYTKNAGAAPERHEGLVFKYTVVKPEDSLVHGITAVNFDQNPGHAFMRIACGIGTGYYQCPRDQIHEDFRLVTCLRCIDGDLPTKVHRGLGAGTISKKGSPIKLKTVV